MAVCDPLVYHAPKRGAVVSDAKSVNAAAVECIIPILRVQNLPASIRFYTELLGFQLDWEAPEMASVSRDGHAIMLCPGAQGQPGTWIWIGIGEIDALFTDCTAKGITIRQKPTNRPWAYEMQIEDPDGHVLRIGSEPRTDLPLA